MTKILEVIQTSLYGIMLMFEMMCVVALVILAFIFPALIAEWTGKDAWETLYLIHLLMFTYVIGREFS